MVLPASAADEGQAGRSAWLERLRGILELGREGVLILVPNGQSPQLLPLIRTLWAVDEGARLVVEAESLAECGDNELLVLALRARDASWLNRNRPLFAQRRLRVVLWADEELVGEMRGRAPDFFDWISHVIECPFGVPAFTRRGLAVGSSWHPGMVWRGGLELGDVLSHLGVTYVDGPGEVEYPAWVEFLAACQADFVRVAGLSSSHTLRRIRWARAEARFAGTVILDAPHLDAPGWFPVDAQQQPLAEIAAEQLELGVLLEAEREALSLVSRLDSDQTPPRSSTPEELDQWVTQQARDSPEWTELRREAVTMRRGGPLLRALFAGEEFRDLVVQIIAASPSRPGRHELALLPGLGVDEVRASFPANLRLELALMEKISQELLRGYVLERGEELGWDSTTALRVTEVALERARDWHALAEAIADAAQHQLGPRSLDLARLHRLLAAVIGARHELAAARAWLERACETAGLECDVLAALELHEGQVERGLARLHPLCEHETPSLRVRQLLTLALRMHGQSDRAAERIESWVDGGEAKAADFEFGPPREWLRRMLGDHFEAQLSD